MDKKDKLGISLVILVITMIVMIILAGAGIVITSTVITNSKKSTFAEDLGQIQDAVDQYYLDTNSLPVVLVENVPVTYAKAAFLALHTDSALATEFTFHSDDGETNEFYEIDLAKINVLTTSRGTRENDNPNDIYVVSKDTRTVYYYDGYVISGTRYYSVTSSLIDIENVANTNASDESNTTVGPISDIKATKSTELYTNTITISLTTNIGGDIVWKKGTSTTGTTLTIPATITLDSTSFNQAELADFVTNKYIKIEKNNLEVLRVDISNLDIAPPTISSTTLSRTATEFNLVNVVIGNANDGGSNIDGLYYDYVTKLDELNAEVDYYSTNPTVTVEYLKTFGKKITSNSIKLPKNIQSIKLIAVDEAGNSSAVTIVSNIAAD